MGWPSLCWSQTVVTDVWGHGSIRTPLNFEAKFGVRNNGVFTIKKAVLKKETRGSFRNWCGTIGGFNYNGEKYVFAAKVSESYTFTIHTGLCP